MKADQEQRYSSDSERRSEKKAGTIRTLKDAGCNDALIRRFLFLQEDGEPSECLCLLLDVYKRQVYKLLMYGIYCAMLSGNLKKNSETAVLQSAR